MVFQVRGEKSWPRGGARFHKMGGLSENDMSTAPLYTNRFVEVELRADPSHDIVWFGLKSTPAREEIERLCTVVGTYIAHTERKFALHLQHSGEDAPLDAASLLCLVGRLLEHRDAIDSKLLGTCIQTTRLDDTARATATMFLSLYNPKSPFEMTDSEASARAFLKSLHKCS